MRRIFFIVSFIFIFFVSANCFALSVGTHREINRFAVLNAASSLDATLNNYYLTKGILETIPATQNKTIIDYIIEGGELEDNAPFMRYLNHFHNPLKPWDSSGLSGVTGLSGFFIGYNNSAPIWAQRKTINYNSWPAARDYLYLALTASDGNSRNTNFIDCFHSVGMVMHLVQDMSVPAHVRNDSHPLGNIYEVWVDNEREYFKAEFNQYLSSYTFTPDPSLFKKGYNPDATIPIAGLFDADLYNGSNPDVTAGANVGMAEYTNANFLSENTAFEEFDYPANSSTVIMDLVINTNPVMPDLIIKRPYYIKLKDGESSAYCLATVNYLKDYVINKIEKLHNMDALPGMDWAFQKFVIAKELKEKNGLDDYCYADYAMRLLPRAAGYSKALLEYFFRGQIDAVDAKTTKDGSGNITGVTIKVKNSTPGEPMYNGKLLVAYKYKAQNATDYTYGVSLPITGISLAADATSNQLTFNFESGKYIPANATEKTYMLVYRGKLGQEDDAVAGKSFKTHELNYLFIKQRGYQIQDVSSKMCSSPPSYSEDLRSDFLFSPYSCVSMDIGWYDLDVDFDLLWLNEPVKIKKVEIRYLNEWNNMPTIAESTYELTEPNSEDPNGHLRVKFKLPEIWDKDYWGFNNGPKIFITTTGADGKDEVYEEYIVFSWMKQTKLVWEWGKFTRCYFYTYIYKGGFDLINPALLMPTSYYFYDEKTRMRKFCIPMFVNIRLTIRHTLPIINMFIKARLFI